MRDGSVLWLGHLLRLYLYSNVWRMSSFGCSRRAGPQSPSMLNVADEYYRGLHSLALVS